jgi:hypothetical protein
VGEVAFAATGFRLDVFGPYGVDSASEEVEVGTRVFADDFETGDTIGWDG